MPVRELSDYLDNPSTITRHGRSKDYKLTMTQLWLAEGCHKRKFIPVSYNYGRVISRKVRHRRFDAYENESPKREHSGYSDNYTHNCAECGRHSRCKFLKVAKTQTKETIRQQNMGVA